MRLGIAFLIIALFTPGLVTMAERYGDESQVSEARVQADAVVSAADEVWYSGQGSSERVDVSVPSGYEVTFGGQGADAWSYSILKGDSVKSRCYTESPTVMFVGGAVTLSGHCTVVVTATRDDDGRYGVEVDVA